MKTTEHFTSKYHKRRETLIKIQECQIIHEILYHVILQQVELVMLLYGLYHIAIGRNLKNNLEKLKQLTHIKCKMKHLNISLIGHIEKSLISKFSQKVYSYSK